MLNDVSVFGQKNMELNVKDNQYYNFYKNEFAPLIPEGPNKILDIGCAAGQLGYNLRKLNKTSELVGIELFEPAAMEAMKYYDRVYIGNVEDTNLDYKDYFDFVICGDILEHLYDPWTMLSKIHGFMKNGGYLISTIPNIRYWCILRDLIFLGEWEYTEAGILDNTHLRFFTRKAFLKTLQKSHYTIDYHRMLISGRKKRFLDRISLGIFEEFLGMQILVMARKKDSL